MSRVNTKEKLMEAAAKLFMAEGYQKASIARIETEAGLVPRAGAFYRHFESKEALLKAVARAYVSETPDDFGLEKLFDYNDTRAELIAIALKYEEAMERQKPFARLIEEIRLLDVGAELEGELNIDMNDALVAWIGQKPAARDLSPVRKSTLIISVVGGWIFFLSMAQRGIGAESLRESLLDDWATRWASVLDTEPSG